MVCISGSEFRCVEGPGSTSDRPASRLPLSFGLRGRAVGMASQRSVRKGDPLEFPPPSISNPNWTKIWKSAAGPCIDITDGVVSITNVDPPWELFTPTSDGRRLLDNSTTYGTCQLAGRTIAVETQAKDSRLPKLFLFQGPSGRLLTERMLTPKTRLFRYLRTGETLGEQNESAHPPIEVTDAANSRQVSSIGWASTHPNMELTRRQSWLCLTIGSFAMCWRIRQGAIAIPNIVTQIRQYKRGLGAARPSSAEPTQYDSSRYRLGSIRGTASSWISLEGKSSCCIRTENRLCTY